MSNQILDYLGNASASYIHARGKISTDKIFELLEPKKEEKILEIGFGTGATLVQMAAQSNANFFGYEASPIMYQTALKRIQFCNMSDRINLVLLERKNQFPAADNSFDRVYIESIIAIQEGSDFKYLLLEIKRVLKPNGVLLFNETIWLDTTEKNQAIQINEKCKAFFGIIQASHDYLHVQDWRNVLEEIGFIHQLEIPVREIIAIKQKTSLPVLRSKIFTLIGKIKVSLTPALVGKWNNYKRNMDLVMNTNEKLMEGIIIKAYNEK